MKKLWLLIFTVMLSAGLVNGLAAQNGSDTLKAARVVISTSLTEYFPSILLNTGNLNFGTEIYLKNRSTIHFNVGMIRSYGPSGGLLAVTSLGTSGFNVQAEKRYYFGVYKLFEPAILFFPPHLFQFKSQKLRNTGYYFSVHSLYQLTTTLREIPVFDFYNPDTEQRHLYTVNRSVYGVNLKIGYQCIKKSRFVVDFAVGAGLRYFTSVSRNFPKMNEERNSSYDLPSGKKFDSGSGWLFLPLIRFQLGWTLGVGEF